MNETSSPHINAIGPCSLGYHWRVIIACELIILFLSVLYVVRPSKPVNASRSSMIHTHPSPQQGYGGDLQVRHEKQSVQDLLATLNMHLDPRLSNVAKIVLKQVQTKTQLLPLESLNFYLNANGVTYWDTEQIYLETEQDDDLETFRKILSTQTYNESPFGSRIGFAQTWEARPNLSRRILVLVAHPQIILDPFKRQLSVGEGLDIVGKVIPTVGNVRVIAMDTHRKIFHAKLGRVENRVRGNLLLTRGQWTVEIIGDTPTGPLPLAQFSISVGCLPLGYFRSDDVNPRFASLSPRNQLLEMINESRAKFNLGPLRLSAALNVLAQEHTEEMARYGYVGHRSKRTGEIGDRLRTVGIELPLFAENIGKNTSIEDLHRSLMHSISHRLNILHPDMTELGLGMVEEDGHWIVTQIFGAVTEQITQI